MAFDVGRVVVGERGGGRRDSITTNNEPLTEDAIVGRLIESGSSHPPLEIIVGPANELVARRITAWPMSQAVRELIVETGGTVSPEDRAGPFAGLPVTVDPNLGDAWTLIAG